MVGILTSLFQESDGAADIGGGPGRYALWLASLGPHLIATGIG